eukprot:PITA_35611
MDSFLLESGFSRFYSDNTVYTKKVGNSLIILVLYVDDLILTGSDPNLINHVKSRLKKKFEMTNLGHLHYFLGLQVLQSKEVISLSQSKYACDILRHFHMEDCKPAPSPFQSGVKLSVSCPSPEVDATLYRQLVGKLLYLTHTHPDLSFVVGLVARFMQNPRENHWKATKRILRYVRGTVQFWIHYSAKAAPLLVGFTDSDWAGDPDDRKSTAGYVFILGSGPITWACKKQAAISLSSAEADAKAAPLLVGFTDSDWAGDPDDRKSTVRYVFALGSGPITWPCKKQASISLSSAEAEYRGAVEASKEALWIRRIVSEFGFEQQHPSTLWCDNQSVIQLCKDPVQHQRNKHIELHMHFIRKLIHDHVLEVQYCSTDDQVAEIFTKALTEAKFTKLRYMLGVQEVVTKGG